MPPQPPPQQKPISFFARRPALSSSTGLTSDPFEPLPQSSRPAPPQSVLAVEIPPSTLRPIAFRVFTKKHNLTLKSDALALLCGFVGRKCGADWRDTGAGEKLLDEVARQWKRSEGAGKILVDGGAGLKTVLKALDVGSGERKEGLKRVGTFDLRMGEMIPSSALMGGDTEDADVEMEGVEPVSTEKRLEVGEYLKVVDAYEMPRLLYNATRRQFERHSKPSLFPSPASKTALFRHRYTLLHSRLLRNESFLAPTYTKTAGTKQTFYKITAISALLGRAGQSFLLFGMLAISPHGTLSLYDPTGELPLETTHCAPCDAIFLCPGMFLLIDGMFEESGTFTVFTVISPPPERRVASAEIFGHVDFLGTGIPLDYSVSGGGATGRAMRKAEKASDSRFVFLGELPLDQPKSLHSLRSLLAEYADAPPQVLVLFGSFSSTPITPGSSTDASRCYKEGFDSLANLLADFPDICTHTTIVLVPGDNDPWTSTFSAGASPPFPRPGIPKEFLTRLHRLCRRVAAPSNPCRLSFFTSELLLVRDDLHARFARNAASFGAPPVANDEHAPPAEEADLVLARKMVKTLLDQGWVSPFHMTKRPVLWEFAQQACSLYPLPTALVVCDAGVQPWNVTYDACRTVNVGRAGERREVRWVEWGCREAVATVRTKEVGV